VKVVEFCSAATAAYSRLGLELRVRCARLAARRVASAFSCSIPLSLGLPLDPEQVQKLAACWLLLWGSLMIHWAQAVDA